MSRPPLSLPISLAVSMIVLLVLLTVGWVVMSVRRILSSPNTSVAVDWTLLVLGILFLLLVVAGVVVYLTLSIKAINLTRRQSNFIDSVTHELKSPIASLKLYLQTLSRRPVNPEETTEFYRCMLEDVERLDLLINHILAAARLDKASGADDSQRIMLGDLVTQCARDMCLQHRVPLETVTLQLEPCVIQGNPAELGLVFRNLLDNAIKYAAADNPEVGLSVRFQALQGRAVVRISDNGPGIPVPLRRKIFGRFVRLGTELERKQPGTGLGLYIVRTLVSRWKGRVTVTNCDGVAGAVFEVSLPNASIAGLQRQAALEHVGDRDGEGRSSGSPGPNSNPPADSPTKQRLDQGENALR